MKKENKIKMLTLIVRATGIIFWYNFISEIFFNEFGNINIWKTAIMIISLVLGYFSNKEIDKLKEI